MFMNLESKTEIYAMIKLLTNVYESRVKDGAMIKLLTNVYESRIEYENPCNKFKIEFLYKYISILG
jgi:hypothetical protein